MTSLCVDPLGQGHRHRRHLGVTLIIGPVVAPVTISQLTKILSAPDVHLGIILSQVVKPGLVNDKDSSSYDRRPGSKEKER